MKRLGKRFRELINPHQLDVPISSSKNSPSQTTIQSTPHTHTVETPKEGKQKTANEKAREEKKEIKNCTKEEEQRFQREKEVNVSGGGRQARGSSN